MPLHPDFRDMLSALIAEDAEFLLVGAMAVAAHGYPRATGDMDVLVNPTRENAGRVWKSLARFGAPLGGLSPADLENPALILQLGVPPWRIDILTSIRGVDFGEAWRDRITRAVDGLDLPVLSRDHLIRNKRAVARPQDLADVARLEGANRPRP